MTERVAPPTVNPPAPDRRSCESCDFFASSVAEPEYGQCRKSGPLLISDFGTGVWPRTTHLQWCGEYVSRDLEIATEGQAMATLKSLAVELDTAAAALLAAAEAFRVKGGMVSQANKAYAAHMKARTIAYGYIRP